MVGDKEIESDFKEFKSKTYAIILFGSSVRKEQTKKSDIDVCLVAKDFDEKKLFDELLKSNVTQRYDVKIFELLPLKLKGEIIENHRIIWAKNNAEMSYYFYKFRKLWEDQKLARKRIGEKIFA